MDLHTFNSGFDHVMTWAKDNQIIFGLLASAIISTMPADLPTWKQFPNWMWHWVRDAANTFLNFRGMKTRLESLAVPIEEPPKKEPKPTKKKANSEPPKPVNLNG